MKTVLLVSSLVSMALLIYYVADEVVSPEYKGPQVKYRQRLRELATTEQARREASNYPVRVRQIVSRDLQRTDRCVSCHVAMEDPRMTGERNPLKTHPGTFLDTHDIREIGCTICHDGQGRALNSRDAHAVDIEGWGKPRLPTLFVYSNCARCHEEEDVPGADLLHKGRKLFFSKGCLGCHKYKGKGGKIGSDLTNIADASPHVKYPLSEEAKQFVAAYHWNPNIAYLYEAVKLPQAQPTDTSMMDFDLTDEETLALTVFLKGLSQTGVPASYLAKLREKRQPEPLRGRALFAKYCVACHGEDAIGGVKNINYAKKTVPALNTLAEKMFLEYQEDAEYLAELLEDGTDIENMSPPLDVESARRVLAQYRAIKDLIKKGSPAAKADPAGPTPPLHMPVWATEFSDKAIDSIIAYLLRLYPWEEEEE